jgi:Thioredoxin
LLFDNFNFPPLFSPKMPHAQTVITKAHLEKAMSYAEYTRYSEECFAKGRTTSHSDDLNTPKHLEYTALNFQRMKRIYSTTKLREDLIAALAALPKHQTWLILSESWCGDAAQCVPALQLMAEATPNVEIKLLLRDEHLDIMDAYLTGTARAIPKLICLDTETLVEYGNWGPRPKVAHDAVLAMKAAGVEHDEMITQVHAWYGKDRTKSLQEEMLARVQEWSK